MSSFIFFSYIEVMIKAFYDSLDTLQKVQFATKRDYINLGIGVVIAVVVFGAFFIGVDTIWSGIYKAYYNGMRGSDYVMDQSVNQTWSVSTWSLLDSVDLWDTSVDVQTQDAPLWVTGISL